MARDALVFCEHRVRELWSAALLANYMEALGLDLAIEPVHFRRYANILRYHPRLVMMPFCYTHEDASFYTRFRALYRDSITALNLHHEQIGSIGNKKFFTPKDQESRDALHISWGEQFAEELVAAGVNHDDIYILGNPRFDFLCSRLRHLFPKKTLANEFGIPFGRPWVFVPMNFGFAFLPSDYLLQVKKKGHPYVTAQRDLTVQSLKPFLLGIRDLAKAKAGIEFILRPHPMTPLREYERLLRETGLERMQNIRLIRTRPVHHWIHASSTVITWTTTVAIESLVANKPTLRFEPVRLPEWAQMDFFGLLPTAHNSEELQGIFEETMDSRIQDSRQVKNYLESQFYRIDGMATFRLALVVKELLGNHGVRKEMASSHWELGEALRLFMKVLSRDLPKEALARVGLLGKVAPFYAGLLEDNFRNRDIKQVRDILKPFSDAPLDAQLILKKTPYGKVVSFE